MQMAEFQATRTPFVVQSRLSQFSARLELWSERASATLFPVNP